MNMKTMKVMLAVLAITMVAGTVHADVISVPNYSFELNGGSWTAADNWTGGFAMGSDVFGGPPGTDGNYRLGLWWGNGSITQTLADTAIAGATYTLTVAAGPYYADPVNQPAIEGQIQLSAGADVIAVMPFNEPVAWAMYDITATGIAPATAAGVPLTLTFTGDNGTSMISYDNVRLTVTPEPATMALLVIGGIAALLRRRK